MTYEPTATQILFLWRLATAGGEDWKKVVKPDLKTAQRKSLISEGFIRERWEKDPRTKARGLVLSLEDAGWLWLKEHLDANLKGTSTAGGEILGRLLTRLKAFAEASEVDIADILCNPEAAVKSLSHSHSTVPATTAASLPAGPALADDNGTDLATRIRRAYLGLSPDRQASFVRLSDLRAALCEVDRAALDETLWNMASERELVLYPLNNPQEIRTEDEEAALHTAAGEPRHVVIFSE